MRYYGNGVLIFALDLGVMFLGIPNWVIHGVLRKIRILVLNLSWKSVSVVSLYTYFWGVFLLKRCEKWGVCVIALKTTLKPSLNIWSGEQGKGSRQNAAIQTTEMNQKKPWNLVKNGSRCTVWNILQPKPDYC